MKRKILSLMVFGILLIATMPKKANATCIEANLSCYDGYLLCGRTAEIMIEILIDAENKICN